MCVCVRVCVRALKSNAQGKDTAGQRHKSPGLRILLELFLLFQLGPQILLKTATRVRCSRMTATESVACRAGLGSWRKRGRVKSLSRS